MGGELSSLEFLAWVESASDFAQPAFPRHADEALLLLSLSSQPASAEKKTLNPPRFPLLDPQRVP